MNSIIKNEIINQKKENFQHMFYVFFNSFHNWVFSSVQYGMNHEISKRNWNVFHNYYQIVKEEKLYLDYLSKVFKFHDANGVLDFLSVLEHKQQEGFQYFFKVLEEFNDFINFGGDLYRFAYPLRSFKFITETDELRNEVTSFVLGKEFKKKYFTFEREFWKYMKCRTFTYDGNQLDQKCYGGVVPYFDLQHILYDINLYVPTITGYDTLLENVVGYSLAHWYYQHLNQTFCDESERIIEEEEKRFQEEYFLPNKRKLFPE